MKQPPAGLNPPEAAVVTGSVHQSISPEQTRRVG